MAWLCRRVALALALLPCAVHAPAGASMTTGGGGGVVDESTGIVMTKAFDFGSSAMQSTKGAHYAKTSRVNQNFLRRGTRADLERIHIERLLGKRGPDDWLMAGSDQWIARRTRLDNEALELRERLAILDACATNSLIEEWDAEFGCNLFCGLRWPCTNCNDGAQNGDESDVDCGGSCTPCPTCDDFILNGQETGLDCGGEDCPACEVFIEPEQEPGGWVDASQPDVGDPDGSYRPPGCTAEDARNCIIHNEYTAMSGAHPANFINYQPESEFYPWMGGSVFYNASHWEEYDTGEYLLGKGQTELYPHDYGITENAHTLYG